MGDSPRPPISFARTVARTEGCTYDANVWELSLVQGAFSVAHCQTLIARFATFQEGCRYTHQEQQVATVVGVHSRQ